MTDSRCKWLLTLISIIISAATAAAPSSFEVQASSSLQRDSHTASQQCIPLLIEFAALDCEYCTLLETEILNPLLRNRDYDQRVFIRKVLIDQSDDLIGFDGKTTNAEKLASRYRVFVTPTLLFVDANGKELSQRMIGVMTLEFYGGYLDQALDESKTMLKQRPHCNSD